MAYRVLRKEYRNTLLHLEYQHESGIGLFDITIRVTVRVGPLPPNPTPRKVDLFDRPGILERLGGAFRLGWQRGRHISQIHTYCASYVAFSGIPSMYLC